jgi:hypothetical protein
LEPLCTAITTIPPPLRSWPRTPQNLFLAEEIPARLQKNDIITFLAEVGCMMHQFMIIWMQREKNRYSSSNQSISKRGLRFPLVFSGRFFHHIPGTENNAGIMLSRGKNGRIRVNCRQDIFISQSYSGSCIALSVGKRKICNDIEMVRPVDIRKLRSIPLVDSPKNGYRRSHHQHRLHILTWLEAYAKFHDMSLYSLKKDRFFLPDSQFMSYLIDQRSILPLAPDSRQMKDTLLWIDPICRLVSSCAGKKAACSQPLPDGDTYVRA